MNNEENIGTRVEKIIEHLKFNVFPILKISFTQKELSRQIDMAEGNITNAKKGDQRYINAFIEKVNNKFGNIINEDWYVSGEGEMLKTDKNLLHTELELPYLTTAAGISYFKTPGGRFIMRVPMVPIYAYAKYIDEFRDADIWEGNGYSYFPVDQIYHGNYQAFEIKGDSMDDDSKRSLSHGDIVNARELSRDKWTSRLHTDQYPNWIIVTDNTILCKQIIDQNLDTGDIICHSLNPSPEYTDFPINLNDVRKLFNIVQRVTSDFN